MTQPTPPVEAIHEDEIDVRARYYAAGIAGGDRGVRAVVDLTPVTYNLRYYDIAQDTVAKPVWYEGRPHEKYASVGEARARCAEPFGVYLADLDACLREEADGEGAARTGVLVALGDLRKCIEHPCIAKSRPRGCANNVLLPLDADKHFRHVRDVLAHDSAYADKDDKMVWRGGQTGVWTPERGRLCLLEKYACDPDPGLDVGLAHAERRPHIPARLKKPFMSVRDQLRSKFVLSVEGNDVATNLKWVLASNAVPVMPSPTVVSWAMEDTLVPWEHYVPVRADFADLKAVHRWCREHPEECRRIAHRGKEFVSRFLDPATERAVIRRVLAFWRENVSLRAVNAHQQFGPDVDNVIRFA